MSTFDSEQNNERIAKLVIVTILLVDLAVLIFVIQTLVGFWDNIVGGI